MSNYLRVFFSLLLLVNRGPAAGQARFNAGFAEASLEPSSYPFSLSLAGYGSPGDGRFTLEWIRKPDQGGTKVFDGIVKLPLKWKRQNELINARAIAVFGNQLFVAGQDGGIQYRTIRKSGKGWKNLPSLVDVQSLAAAKGSLYALTKKDDIWKLELGKADAKWIKIARYNAISYDVHLKSIAIVNDTLLGKDINDVLYTGRHRTEEDLSVTALAVSSGKQTVVTVGADLCGFDYSFIISVKKEVYRRTNIPAQAILINASHTHFAPVSQNWLTWGEHNQRPDSAYLYGTVGPAMVAAIVKAVESMEPSRLYFGRGQSAIGGNRAFKTAPLPYDDALDIIQVVRERDQEKTVLFLAGCHPVFSNSGAEGITISANYPGAARRWLAAKAGIKKAIFIQGCGGDINPLDANHEATGNKLASSVVDVMSSNLQELQGELSFYLDSVLLPVKAWTKEELLNFKAVNTGKEGDVYAEKNQRWADLMLGLYEADKIPGSMPVYIQTINIGSWKLVGLSRETATDYSIGIKKIWPNQLVSVAGYCNDVSSYLPVGRHIKEGVYEGYDSFFWYGQPSVFPENVYETILEKIKQSNH